MLLIGLEEESKAKKWVGWSLASPWWKQEGWKNMNTAKHGWHPSKKGLMNIAYRMWVGTLWTWSCCPCFGQDRICPKVNDAYGTLLWHLKTHMKSRIPLFNELYKKYRMKRFPFCTEFKSECESRANDTQRQEVANRRQCLWGKMRLPSSSSQSHCQGFRCQYGRQSFKEKMERCQWICFASVASKLFLKLVNEWYQDWKMPCQ